METTHNSQKPYRREVRNTFKKLGISLIAVIGFIGTLSSWAQDTGEWIDCAGENETCAFEGTQSVRYGANGLYAYGIFENEVWCGNSTFGDPARRTVKRCAYSSSINLPPTLEPIESQYSLVGETVLFNISASDPDSDPLTYDISGLPAALSYNTATGAISGTTDILGEFNVSVTVSDSSGAQVNQSFVWTISEPSEWLVCAAENEFCDFSGSAEVRYGAEPDLYHYGEFVDGVNCSNAVFGDPARRTVKLCSYKIEFVPFSVTPIENRENFVGRQVSLQVRATSSSTVFDFQESGLPSGLSLDPSSGLISGSPDTEGTYAVSITVSDGLESPIIISFTWAINAPLAPASAASSSSILYQAIDADNDQIWVVNPDNNSVSIFDVINDQKIIEIPVGKAPQSVSLIGAEAWIVNRDSATISIIDTSDYSIATTLDLPSYSQPYGIVADGVSETLFVALAGTGQILKIDMSSRTILDTLEVGQDVRGLAIDASGNFLYASRFITPAIPDEHTATPDTSNAGGQLIVIALGDFSVSSVTKLAHSEEEDTRLSGRGIPNYLGSMAISPDGASGWVPSKQDNIMRGTARDGFNINHENSVRAISSVIDLATHTEALDDRIDHDNASLASAAIFHPSGNYLFVALETSREVALIDLASGIEIHRISAGLAPQALALSPTGDTLFVHNFMDRSVTRHDVGQLLTNQTTSAPVLATYNSVDAELLDPTVLEGKQLFYDAADPRLALEGYLSCASCHNDGGHDGRVWDLTGFGEGLRNTIPLQGRAGLGHGRLHWTGNFDEVQDFEGQIRALAGGTGLMDDIHFFDGSRNEPLGDSKTGFSSGLDAIAAYLTSLTEFSNSPLRAKDQPFSDDAQSGKALFAQSGCVSCHNGSTFSDSDTSSLHDVGTAKSLSGSRLGEALSGFDTPTLRGLWQSAPYLHDGSAISLQDAIRAHNNAASLSDESLDDIASYLLEIDPRESSAPAPDVWQLCASENETCTFSGTKQVRYGANGVYNYGNFENSVQCRNSVFGDPIPKTAKFCYYRLSDEALPELSNPGAQNSLIGDAISLSLSVSNDSNLELSFTSLNLPVGLTIDSTTGTLSGTVTTEGNFNVSVSVISSGIVQDTIEFIWVISDPSNPDSEWIYCGEERSQCSFTGEAEVRYGANGIYAFGTYTNGVSCSNSVFGDPTPRIAKSCEYRLLPPEALEISNPGNQSSEVGDLISLQIDLESGSAESLSYTATNLPLNLSIDSSTGLITGVLTVEDIYLGVQVSVSNSAGESSSAMFNWFVFPNQGGDNEWAFCATENGFCSFEGTKEVRYGSETNYFYGIFEDGVSCSNATFGDPTPKIAKNCDVRTGGNIPPVVTNPGSKVSALNSNVSFYISATDPEGEDVSFSATGIPDGISLNANTGEFSGAPTTINVFDVLVTASDASGASNQASFTWTIQTEVQGNDNWVLCASEGEICNFDGEARVHYGANGQYNSEFFTDSVFCSKSAFGDPLPGIVKSCYYELDPEAADWTFCADQDELCVITGTKLVRYGAQRAFNQIVANSSINCSDTEFGDPIQGVFKRCEVKDIDSEDAYDIYPIEDEDEQWVYCSPNNFTCHFDGTKQVRYILGDAYSEITATDYVLCSEESFPSDPVVHVKKKEHCEVKLSRSEAGEWSNVQAWPVIPVSASLMPDGRILANNATNDDLYLGYSDVTIWDPVSNTFSMLNSTASTFAEQSSEMFCSGFDLMPDGNMLLAGAEPNVGSVDNLNATRYDFRGERFSRVNDNEYFRYYPSMTTMPTGDMVTFAGTSNAAPLEIFRFDGSWDTLSDTQDTYLNDYTYYAWGQTAPNGQLFYPGPDAQMKYFDLRGEGEEISLGARDGFDRDYGSYALYDIGKILITGGAKPATDTTTLIDINGPSPVVSAGASMGMPRRHGNLTILANGDLLKTGGHTGTTHQGFQPEKAVYSSEIWSPETGQWTTTASMKVNRLYHSTAVLLPDGRVMSGGTGYPFYVEHNQLNGEIYSPPYLFNADGTLADRPMINNAPDSVGYDHNFTVGIDTNLAIAKVHMIKLGTVTHHQNFGQRLVPLEFTQNGDQLEVVSPEGANIAPPGYYMLIAVDADGRPSVAKITQVLPHATINLRSGSTGFVLDIAWGDTYENAFASLSANNNNLSQLWSMQTTDSGYFKFISRASGYALTNMDGVLSLGSDTGSFEEQWRFVEADEGYYALQSRSDNMYLSADMSNPGQLTLSNSPAADSSAQWQVLPVGDINLVAELTGHLLDAGDTEYGGSEVFVERNEGAITQAWYFEAAEDGYSTIRARSGNKALALSDSGAGSSIIQENFVNAEHQQWRLAVNTDGSFKIESRSSQLPVANNGEGSGLSQVGVSDSSEAWRIVPAVSGQPENTSEGGGQILYRTLVQQTGLLLWQTNGQTSGSPDLDKPIETLEVTANGIRDELSVEYQVFDEITGWSGWTSDGGIAGELGEPIFGLRARLAGQSEGCALRYRVYTGNNSWTPWSNSEELSGSEGNGETVNGLQIVASCQSTMSSAPSTASAKVNITSNQSNINYSSFRKNAFEIANTSPTQKIVKVEINLSKTSLPDMVFDPVGLAGDPITACFDEGIGGLDTGFMAPLDPCSDPYFLPKDGGYSAISLEFNDFDPGESFFFGGDIDPTSIKNATNEAPAGAVSGLELSGASATIYFDDGSTMSNDVFPDGSNAGAQSCLSSNISAAPIVSLTGGGDIPTTSNNAFLSLDVFGETNSIVKVFVFEAALFGDNGSDIDPFESNSVIQVREYLVITDSTGNGSVDIELTETSANGGYNHILAAADQEDNSCTGKVTKAGLVQFTP